MIQKVFFKLLLFLLRFLGFFNFKKNNVAVFCCPLFIGDMVFLFPLIRAMKLNNPERKIIFLCREEFKYLLTFNADIDQVRAVNKSAINTLKNYWAIVNATYFYLPMADYWKRLARAIHAKNIISFDSPKNFNALKLLGIQNPHHLSEYLLELLPPDEFAKIDSKPYLKTHFNYPNLLVIQCDGRNSNTKVFTDIQLEKMIEAISAFPIQIKLMGLYRPLKKINFSNVIDLRGRSSFEDWLKYILGADFVVGLDSAAAQLRKAAGKSAYILMGPADNLFFGNTTLFSNINLTANDNLSCRDRKVFQGHFFKTLNNCQKNVCNNPNGRVCIDGKIFNLFLDKIRNNLELLFKV